MPTQSCSVLLSGCSTNGAIRKLTVSDMSSRVPTTAVGGSAWVIKVSLSPCTLQACGQELCMLIAAPMQAVCCNLGGAYRLIQSSASTCQSRGLMRPSFRYKPVA